MSLEYVGNFTKIKILTMHSAVACDEPNRVTFFKTFRTQKDGLQGNKGRKIGMYSAGSR
jgi:hypothetical protein